MSELKNSEARELQKEIKDMRSEFNGKMHSIDKNVVKLQTTLEEGVSEQFANHNARISSLENGQKWAIRLFLGAMFGGLVALLGLGI